MMNNYRDPSSIDPIVRFLKRHKGKYYEEKEIRAKTGLNYLESDWWLWKLADCGILKRKGEAHQRKYAL